MVTRRRFISITLMILALFVLFQGPQFIREKYNEYEINSYYTVSTLFASDVWDDAANAREEIILIAPSDALASALQEWAVYSKRRVVIQETLASAVGNATPATKCVVIPKQIWNETDFEQSVYSILDKGIPVLFSELPDVSRISKTKKGRMLLGIDKIVMDTVEVDGIRLFDGFFLGGERIFKPFEEKDEKRQDLQLIMPWYRTGAGAEVFMMGVFEDDKYKDEKLDNEELPPIIWSCGHEKAKTYAVMGDYMNDRMVAIGIMSAVMADSSEILLYPVVNSQQLQILNYPSLANENEEEMIRLYSRSQTQFERNIVYPGIVADTDGNGFNLTAYISPQYDYLDENEPVKGELIWYLSQLKEQKAEIGYSLVHDDRISLAEKLEKDLELLNNEAGRYQFSAVYVQAEDVENALNMLPERLKTSVHTVCTEDLENKKIVDYLNHEVTVQQSTATVNSYTYFNDLQMLSAETALGYASISIDMKRILWPETEEDQWQKASKEIFSIVDTYWKNFNMFAKTTASQTDRNIRNLLAVNYRYDIDGDTIELYSEKFTDSVSFILRTHNKKIKRVSNGSFKRIEQDAYLITIDDMHCEITLEDDINMKR